VKVFIKTYFSIESVAFSCPLWYIFGHFAFACFVDL